MSLAFSPDGSLLATPDGFSGTVSMFSVGGGGVLSEVPGSPFSVSPVCDDSDACFAYKVAFSPDGRLLAELGDSGAAVSVFSVGEDGTLTPVPGSPFATGGFVYSLAFSPDGSLLVSTDDNADTVSVFSVSAGGALTQIPGSPFPTGTHGDSVSVAFSPDGSLLATGNLSDVSVFSVAADGSLSPVAGSPFPATAVSVAFSPGGTLLAAAAGSNVSLLSVGPGGVLTPVVGSPFATGGYAQSVAFSPDGSLLATANTGTVSVFSVGSTTAVGPPSASILSPADSQVFNLDQSVETGYTCSDPGDSPFTGESWIESCADSNGATDGQGTLDTSTPGTFTYTVSAASRDGQTGSTSISYTVVGPPSASISTPTNNQTYHLDQSVATGFSCQDAPRAPGIASCTDSNGASGSTDTGSGSTGSGTLDTSTAGTFSYTVTATSQDAQTSTASISYTVVAGTTPQTIRFGWAPFYPVATRSGVAWATASSGLPVTLSVDPSSTGVCSITGGSVSSPATVNYETAGSCVIDANQAGDGTYAAAAQKTKTFTIRLHLQAITFATAPAKPLVGGSGTVSATASSGLPVTLTVAASSSTVCSIASGGTGSATVSYSSAGWCVIDANQSGNGYWAAAPQKTQILTIKT